MADDAPPHFSRWLDLKLAKPGDMPDLFTSRFEHGFPTPVEAVAFTAAMVPRDAAGSRYFGMSREDKAYADGLKTAADVTPGISNVTIEEFRDGVRRQTMWAVRWEIHPTD
jgi:hypothetical protein